MSNDLVFGRIYYRSAAGEYVGLIDIAARASPNMVIDRIREHDFKYGVLGHGGESTQGWLRKVLLSLLRREELGGQAQCIVPAGSHPLPDCAISYVVECEYVVDDRGMITGQNVTVRLADPSELPVQP